MQIGRFEYRMARYIKSYEYSYYSVLVELCVEVMMILMDINRC